MDGCGCRQDYFTGQTAIGHVYWRRWVLAYQMVNLEVLFAYIRSVWSHVTMPHHNSKEWTLVAQLNKFEVSDVDLRVCGPKWCAETSSRTDGV